MVTQETLGQRLRALRGDRTQAEVAAEVGISRSHLAKLEADGDLPSLIVLRALAGYYSVRLDDLDRGASALGADSGKQSGDRTMQADWQAILTEARTEDLVEILDRLREKVALRSKRRSAGENRRQNKPKRRM